MLERPCLRCLPLPGTAEVGSHVRRSPAALVLKSAVLAIVVAGTIGFVQADKTVTLRVDGQDRQVRSFSRTVGDVLAAQGVSVTDHDVVAPAPGTKLRDGQLVTVRYGRLLRLDVDGSTREVWVTARTVDEALAQLGLRAGGSFVSVSRSASIGRSGLALALRTPKTVSVLADGKRQQLVTTVPTVEALLAEAGVTVGPKDRVSQPMDGLVTDGLVVAVNRVAAKTSTRTVAVPFKTVTKDDSSLYKGRSRVSAPGEPGVRTLTYADTYVDGKLTAHKLVSDEVTTAPVDRVVLRGTKALPPPPPPTVSRSYSRSGGSGGGLNWAALARCESGGNPRAVNAAGYYGLYQFSLGTWHGLGGSGNPIDASSSEQTYRAQLLYARSGAGSWPTCGRLLYS
ncbi:MAG: ubiquitin-like domain-containing protein [Motilibacteraceae bacterium]